MALGSPPSLLFNGGFFVSIIPPMFPTHLHVRAAHTRRKNGRNLGTFQKKKKMHWSLGNRGALDRKVLWLSDNCSLKGQICYMRRPTSYTEWRSVNWPESARKHAAMRKPRGVCFMVREMWWTPLYFGVEVYNQPGSTNHLINHRPWLTRWPKI